MGYREKYESNPMKKKSKTVFIRIWSSVQQDSVESSVQERTV